ncbi:L-rhamnose mutarotase [Microbacterium sp. H1-D42]|uniref:L-rhamnose mutarotase n=1 Tax=Microbacterium sp. H1-D42 TaxID=2925844 RepID=UPI001F53D6A4|nr:L-rhamnose mutarotase [Microbacterium sp. H1-D42]UNK71481.1 L-rhamnose mutarotase [Microbacterium sp. H1-D42]
MKRVAQVIGLDPEQIDEYERIHREVWPGVLAQIKGSGIQNYSIYRYGNLLFSYFEYVGDDYEADMAAMAEDPTTQEWWAVCEPKQRPVAEREEGEWWHTVPEVFHLD